jgi:hypothetical protein
VDELAVRHGDGTAAMEIAQPCTVVRAGDGGLRIREKRARLASAVQTAWRSYRPAKARGQAQVVANLCQCVRDIHVKGVRRGVLVIIVAGAAIVTEAGKVI